LTQKGLNYIEASLKDILSSPNVPLKDINKVAGLSASFTICAFGIWGSKQFNMLTDFSSCSYTSSVTAFGIEGFHTIGNQYCEYGLGYNFIQKFGMSNSCDYYWNATPLFISIFSKIQQLYNSAYSLYKQI